MNAQPIAAEDGGRIVILPPGSESAADEVQPTKDGDRVIVSPLPPHQDLES